MTEIKRDNQGNVLCPICGSILYAEVKTNTYGIFQNGESDGWDYITESIICPICGDSHYYPTLLKGYGEFDDYAKAILENFLKHSL